MSLRVQDQLGQYGKILKKRGEGVKRGGREGRREKKKKERKIESTTKGAGSYFLT